MRGLAGGKVGAYREGRRRQVSHLALSTRGIEVPRGADACHRCDNPLCVNPDRTRKINMQDAKAKGRLVGYGVRQFCKQGGDNLYVNPSTGKRRCRMCGRARRSRRAH